MNCPNCETPQPESARFCKHCGTKLETEIEAAAPFEPSAPQPSAPQTPAPQTPDSQPSAPQTPAPQESAPQPPAPESADAQPADAQPADAQQPAPQTPAPQESAPQPPAPESADAQPPAPPVIQIGQPTSQPTPQPTPPPASQPTPPPIPQQQPGLQPQYGQPGSVQPPNIQPQYGQQSGQQYLPGQQPYANYQGQVGQNGQPGLQQPKKKGKGVRIVVFIISAVMLVAIVALIYSLLLLPSCTNNEGPVIERPATVGDEPDLPTPSAPSVPSYPDSAPTPPPALAPGAEADRYYAAALGVSFIPPASWELDDEDEELIFITSDSQSSFVAISIAGNISAKEIEKESDTYFDSFAESFGAETYAIASGKDVEFNGITWYAVDIIFVVDGEPNHVIFYFTDIPEGALAYTYFEMPDYYETAAGRLAEEESRALLETLVIED